MKDDFHSSNLSSSSDPHKVVIVDKFLPYSAPTRSRRGGRLCSLSSLSTSDSTPSQSGTANPSSSRARTSVTPRYSSRGRDHNEFMQEPIVYEIVPQEYSFISNCEAMKK